MTAATDPGFPIAGAAQTAAPSHGLRRIGWTLLLLALWEAVARFGPWPDWIFPPPSAVAVSLCRFADSRSAPSGHRAIGFS